MRGRGEAFPRSQPKLIWLPSLWTSTLRETCLKHGNCNPEVISGHALEQPPSPPFLCRACQPVSTIITALQSLSLYLSLSIPLLPPPSLSLSFSILSIYP